MARQDLNETFLRTAFLYGANAGYIEDLHARYQEDPSSVDADWQAFFAALKDDKQAVAKSARGASWKRPNWPIHENGELVSALDGNWAPLEKAVGDKIKGKAQKAGEIGRAHV
jgi:2-oxoglutarate dehydrogenase E1 component